MRSSLRSSCRCALLLCSLAASPPACLTAQATTATVEGTVTAGHGGVGGATVEIRSRETGESRQAATDSGGAYRVLGLEPGAYDLVARAVGYRPVRKEALDIVAGARQRVDFILDPHEAQMLAPVTVSANASAPLQVVRTDVSSVVLEKEIEQLPLNTRDALALAAISPGVRGRYAGALNSTRFTNLYVDGAEWKGFATGELVAQPGAGSLIPQEAIREYRVSLNPYDAEYTHGGSWVLSAVTHHGGNHFQGSLFAYGQSRDLVAQGTFDSSKPAYHRGQLGGNLRGPILRDRLFFSASYEGQLADNYIDVVPVHPAYSPHVWDQYAGNFISPRRNHLGMLRVTALLGAHTLDAIWLGRQLTTIGGFGTQASGVLQSYAAGVSSSYRAASGQLRDRWVAGALVNELAAQVLEEHDSDAPTVPGVVMQYPGLQTRGKTSYPLIGESRHVTFAEHASITTKGFGGEHLLKGGLEVGRLRGSIYQPTSKDGYFRFATDTSTMPQTSQIGVGFLHPGTTEDAYVPIHSRLAGAYLQDQWRPAAAPSFDFSAGLRWDLETNALNQDYAAPWTGDTTLLRVVGPRYLDPRKRRTNLTNFAPRLAFTWDVGGAGRTSIRGGYGVMYDVMPRLAAFNEQVAWNWRVYVFPNPGTTDPAELRRRVLEHDVQAVPNLTLLPDHLATPVSRQWSVGGGQRIGEHLALQLDYLDQHASHLPVTVKINTTLTGKRPLTSRYGDITLWGDFGDATYHGILTALIFDQGPTRWTAAYTLAWARAEFTGKPNADYGDSAAYAMQASPADERHRLVLSGMTEMPFGFQLSAIGTIASPHPFDVTAGSDVNRDGNLLDDWPQGVRTSRHAGWSYWYRNLDLRVGKTLGPAERRAIATLDLFNVFNTANHSDYLALATSPSYRQPIADFARRQAQVGLRYEF